MQPKVSIVVAVYNVAPYLSACLESLVNQTLKEIEIIVINDCSPDNSLEILEQYAKKDNRIKLINNETNLKTAATRNKGLELAKGEYISFVDGDDFVDGEFFEKLYNEAKSESADIAKGLTRTINKDKTIQISKENTNIRKNGKFYFMANLLTAIYSTKMLRKYNIHFHVDFFCFQIQAVYYANKIACLDDTFYNYIRHENSCDSDIFTIEKWLNINIRHANFIFNWVKDHQYDEKVQQFYLNWVKRLYYYGYNRLAVDDILEGSQILADIMQKNYNCGLNIKNKNLAAELYRKHPKTTFIQYIKLKLTKKL